MSEPHTLPTSFRKAAAANYRCFVTVTAILVGVFMTACSRPAAPPAAPVAMKESVRQAPPVTPVEPFTGPVWFTDVTPLSGIDFVHHSGDSPDKPFPSANGSGLGAIDFDLDGRHDLVFVSGVPFPVDEASGHKSARCYRNLGAWRFDDVTERCGLRYARYGHGVAVGDHDNDGFPDLFLTGYGGDILFHNRGDGTFEPSSPAAGLDDGRWSSSAAFADTDGDGFLDLYVCRYGKWTLENNPYCGDRQKGRRVFCSPLTVEPEPDVLRRNNGDGTFRDATAEAGLDGRLGRGLGVVAAHLDGDDLIDLYVANDMNPNSLWFGNGGGRFRDSSDMSGTAYDHEGKVKSSMGIDVADTGNRGQFDILVTDFQGEENLFFAGSADGIFRDVSDSSGTGGPSLPFVSWGVQFADVDLDGWDDVLISNGHVGDDRMNTDEPTVLQQIPLFLRNERGHFKVPRRAELGTYFIDGHQGRGVVAVDLDNDADPDFVFNHRDEAAASIRNDRGNAAVDVRRIVLRFVGTAGNRDAIGTLVTATTGDSVRRQQVQGGGGYQSSRDRRLLFALPADSATDFTVRWPGGRSETLPIPAGDGQWLVIEPSSADTAARIHREEPLR